MIGEIVRFLEDGQWHALSEIKKNLGIAEAQFEETVGFLRRFGIVEIDAEKRNIRIDPAFLRLPA